MEPWIEVLAVVAASPFKMLEILSRTFELLKRSAHTPWRIMVIQMTMEQFWGMLSALPLILLRLSTSIAWAFGEG